MIQVYLAHPLSAPTREGIDKNRANAAKWAAWLWRQGFSVQCSWIVCTGELEETPENRELGLMSDCEQVRRCDVMALCGPRISGGMLREAEHAKLIVDFTWCGIELPTEYISWRNGEPMRSFAEVKNIYDRAIVEEAVAKSEAKDAAALNEALRKDELARAVLPDVVGRVEPSLPIDLSTRIVADDE